MLAFWWLIKAGAQSNADEEKCKVAAWVFCLCSKTNTNCITAVLFFPQPRPWLPVMFPHDSSESLAAFPTLAPLHSCYQSCCRGRGGQCAGEEYWFAIRPVFAQTGGTRRWALLFIAQITTTWSSNELCLAVFMLILFTVQGSMHTSSH